jgi:hypothetical protein
MRTVAKRKLAKQKLARRRNKTMTKPVPYSPPEPVTLPDWTDDGVSRAYRDAAERREREARRSRIRNFLYHLLT